MYFRLGRAYRPLADTARFAAGYRDARYAGRCRFVDERPIPKSIGNLAISRYTPLGALRREQYGGGIHP